MGRLRPYLEKGRLEAGCDEAGRGCLAGPVFDAAVILPLGFRCPGLNDSKQLTAEEREEIQDWIERNHDHAEDRYYARYGDPDAAYDAWRDERDSRNDYVDW